jgi:hypothetical protein
MITDRDPKPHNAQIEGTDNRLALATRSTRASGAFVIA